MEIICLLLPAFISVYIIQYNKEIKIIDMFFSYVFFNIIINFSLLVITKLFFHTYRYIFTVSFSIKYLIMSSFLAFVYAFVYIYRKKLVDKDFYRLTILNKNFYKNILKKLKSFYLKYHKFFLKIIIFVLIFMLFMLFSASIIYYANKIASINYSKASSFWFTFAYIVLFYGIILLLPKIISRLFLVILYIISLMLYVTHYMLLNIKNIAFSVYDLQNASEGFSFLNFLIKEIKFQFIFTIIVSLILLILLLVFIGKKEKHKGIKKPLLLFLVLVVLFLGFRVFALSHLEKYEKNSWEQISYTRYYYDNFTNNNKSLCVSGLYEYTVRDIYFYYRNKKNTFGSVKEIKERLDARNIQNENNKYTGLFKDKNLILIMMESVDNLTYNEEIMPNLYKLGQEGWNFTKRYSQLSNTGSTFATEYTSLTGLFMNGEDYNLNNNSYPEALPSMFANNGYWTNSIHENNGKYYNRNLYHKSYGFNESYFIYDRIKKPQYFEDSQIVDNSDIYNFMKNSKGKEKFMSYIITISAHGPYINNQYCNEDDNAKVSEYECIKYLANKTDVFIGKLISKLKKDKLLDDTVIILYSDHYAYSYNFSEEDYSLYEKVDDNRIIQNLPFIIYSPDIKHKDFNNIIIDDVDILPTILNLFGITYNASDYIGVDVFSDDHQNIAMFTDYSWYDGNIYSSNADIDKSSNYYNKTSQKVITDLDTNKMIISNNYYSKESK